MRTILTKALIALAITTVAAFGADNTLGTWKLNVEKSKYTPAPFPLKSLTVTREASDGGVKVTITGEQADGTAINATYTTKYDDKGVQVTGNSPYDTIAIYPGSLTSTSSVKISATRPIPLMPFTSLPPADATPADSCPRCCSAYSPQYVIRAASGCPYTAITPHSSRSLSKGGTSSFSSFVIFSGASKY